MMTVAQTQAVKRNLLAAQISYKRSELNEESLYVELHNFFQHLKKTVLSELREYWKDDDSILLEGQLDLILAPIFESQQRYYNILRKHNIKEYNFGCREASRLVKLSRKPVSSLKAESDTIKTNKLLNIGLEKDELFGTNDWTQQQLLNQSFTASENTMNRVDKDINKIISDGYASGAGVNKVAANIETRFEQLKTWEAKRIARTEMHNAHQMGIMNTYYEMGVEYTQWSSAHDSRVRGLKPKDKADHVKMDGEIIPLGGTYSNDLQYPGDTKGPIYEWINCRCGNVPFIMPDGYIAPPGKAQFREEDLIQTLDYWNQDELMSKVYPSSIKPKINTYSDDLVIPRIKNTKDLKEFQNLKNNEEIADFFNLKYVKNGKSMCNGETFEFYDPKHNCTLRFGKSQTNRMKGIDYLNEGNSDYNLTEIIKIYDESPVILKDSCDSILFMPLDDGVTAGETFLEEKIVCMYEPSLRRVQVKGVDLEPFEFDLTHELGHTLDASMSNLKECYNEDLRLSLSREWEIATKKDHKYQIKKFGRTFETTEYGELDSSEDLAEMISVVTNHEKGKNFKVVSSFESEYRTLKEVKDVNPHRYDLAKKYLTQIKKENFVSGSNHNLNNVKQFTVKAKKNTSKIKGYDKYALNKAENKRLKELTIKNEKEGGLKFLERHEFEDLADRKEFNELRNKILLEGGDPTDYFAIPGAEGVRYEKLFKQFKNWEPLETIEVKPIKIKKEGLFKDKDAFKLTSEEKKIYKQAKENTHSLSHDEKEYYQALRDKVEFNRLHKELIEDGLDNFESKKYIDLYHKYEKDWNLPELSLDLKFTTNNRPTYITDDLYKQVTEFKLTKKEAKELYTLEKKELIGKKLSSTELKQMEFLQSKDKFAYLNSVRTHGGGLNYDENIEFKKLYKQLKTKLKLDKKILESPLTNYKSDIPLDKNPQNFKKFKGTTDDGLLPNGEKISDYFTKDARDMNIREQEVAQRWLGKDYKAFTNFEVDCGRDVKKFEKWIYDMAKAYEKDNSLKYYQYYYDEIRDRTTGKLLKSEAKKLAESIAHDVPVLDDILNNQLKQGMTLWRVQEDHNLGNAKVGDIIDFPNFRATAISKEGALWFSGTNAKPMKYIIEIEAPTGTRGAYLAPIKKGSFGGGGKGHAHPHFGENYAKEMEFLLKECKVEVVKIGGRKVKGANGEMLTPIKLRIVGYK